MQRRARDEHGVVVPSRMMLVAIVVVAIAAVMYIATSPGKDAKTDPPAASSSAKKTTPSGTATPTASPSATASSSAPTPSAKPKPVVKRGQTYVEVFNNSGKSGLASRTAAKAQGVGWKVIGSDNWYGTIPTTTVYYPKKLQAAAKMLARDLGIRRVKPATAPMRFDRLTVILTSDYAA